MRVKDGRSACRYICSCGFFTNDYWAWVEHERQLLCGVKADGDTPKFTIMKYKKSK